MQIEIAKKDRDYFSLCLTLFEDCRRHKVFDILQMRYQCRCGFTGDTEDAFLEHAETQHYSAIKDINEQYSKDITALQKMVKEVKDYLATQNVLPDP